MRAEHINIVNDGRTQLVKSSFTVIDLPDGSTKVEIYARTLEDIQKTIPNPAARFRMTENKVIFRSRKARHTSLVEKDQAACIQMGSRDVLHFDQWKREYRPFFNEA